MGFFSRFLAAVVVGSALVSCQERATPNAGNAAPQGERPPDQKMERLRLQAYGQQGLEWELVSPLSEGYSANGCTVVQNLKVDLFSQSQKSTTITADKGLMYSGGASEKNESFDIPVVLEPGDMFLEGHVVLVSTEGHTLSTDWAHYKKKFELIVSSAPVELVREDSITKGIGLEATPDLSVVKIFKETLVIPDQSPNAAP